MSISFTISTPDLDKLSKLYANSPEATKTAMDTALRKSAITIQRVARQEAPVDTGKLRSSINYHQFFNEVRVTPDSNYAIYVHEGTRAHMAPIGALSKWGARHGINGYALRSSIRVKGTKANPFMARAAALTKQDIQGYFGTAVQQVIKHLNS